MTFHAWKAQLKKIHRPNISRFSMTVGTLVKKRYKSVIGVVTFIKILLCTFLVLHLRLQKVQRCTFASFVPVFLDSVAYLNIIFSKETVHSILPGILRSEEHWLFVMKCHRSTKKLRQTQRKVT